MKFVLISLLLWLSPFIYGQINILSDERENYAEVASAYFEDGQWEKGQEIVEKALSRYPKDSDLRTLMGKCHLHFRRYDRARYELLKSLEYEKENWEAKQVLLNVEIESGRYSSAICYINELLEISPYGKALWIKKIEAYRLQGNHVEANRLLKRLNQIYPEDYEVRKTFIYYMEEEAREKAIDGKITEAIELTLRLTEIAPENEEIYIELINYCLKAGDFSNALIHCDRGLYNLPASIRLIDKKSDILASMQRYDELYSFLQQKKNENADISHIEERHSYFLLQAARHYRLNDPYYLYSLLYEKNPSNREAFNYLLNTSIASGRYEEAMDIIRQAQKRQGQTKFLLLKEREIYERRMMQGKADQITIQLYQLDPYDTDIFDAHVSVRIRQGKERMQEQDYFQALEHWLFVEDKGEPEDVYVSLAAQFNCFYAVNRLKECFDTLHKLMELHPDEPEWYFKKAMLFNSRKQYPEALDEYRKGLALVPMDQQRFWLAGYEEMALPAVKSLIETYQYPEAAHLLSHWLDTSPNSRDALYYAVQLTLLNKEHDQLYLYAYKGVELYPEDHWFKIKLGEAYLLRQQPEQAYQMLLPEVQRRPWHAELSGILAEAGDSWAQELMKAKQYDEAMEMVTHTLELAPDNKELKYRKGLLFEKLNQPDSAWIYQSYYEPALTEFRSFRIHLDRLKNKGYKNKATLSYLRSRHNDSEVFNSVSTLEYIRFGKTDSYTGRINYSGRAEGKGLQGEFEWNHYWTPGLYTRFHLAGANRYFASFMSNLSFYKTLPAEWEVEAGAGYRRLADNKNMVNGIAGITKELDMWWLNSRINMLVLDNRFYYSLAAQARFLLGHPTSYVMVAGSFGSAPDVDILDYHFYNAFSVTNSMVGAGFCYMLTDRITAGLLGNCYNYKEDSNLYRNFYTLHFQLYVSF